MLFPSATVVAAMVLSLAGTSPLAIRTDTRGAAGSAVAASTKVAAGLWAPKKSKPRPAREGGEDPREEELLKSRTPANNNAGGGGGTSQRTKRRGIKMDESAEEGEEEAEEGGEEEEEEDTPRVKKRKRVVEEEVEPDPIESQPVIIPRLINVGISTSFIRRSFGFNDAALQGDAAFRLGYQIAVESFPLVTQPNGWYRTLGLGVSYEKQYGDATHDMSNGMFNGYPLNQSRLGIDVRFAIPAGEWVIVMPAVGYGTIAADLQRPMPTTPSNCTTMSATDPCFGDVKASYLSVDVHIRVGLTPTFGLSLAGGYMHGLGVANGTDQFATQGNATMKGFHVDASANVLLTDWLAVQATIPFRRYGYALTPAMGQTFSYRGAADTYYGLIAGLALFTK